MIEWLLLAVLIVLSVVDIIWKKFPAGFLTGLLFLVAVSSYISYGISSIAFGMFCFIIAWMFLEFGVPINGVADLKAMTMIGFIIADLRFIFLFIAMIMVLGFVYQFVCVRAFRLKENDEIPFIPLITIVYIALMLLGGVA